ncbi:MAG: CBS domain-containing protein [Candidatus Dormibacteria bacterium]
MVLVKDIMSRDVLKISESASVVELTSILTRHRITGLPVLNNKGALVGVVSEFDVIERKGRHVGDIMSRDPITITSDSPISEVARLFVEHHIRRAPVMDGTKMVGIVSRSDIVRFFATKQWLCGGCGYSDRGFNPPEGCPNCSAAAERFTLAPAPAG